jgi:hypothetical protein
VITVPNGIGVSSSLTVECISECDSTFAVAAWSVFPRTITITDMFPYKSNYAKPGDEIVFRVKGFSNPSTTAPYTYIV